MTYRGKKDIIAGFSIVVDEKIYYNINNNVHHRCPRPRCDLMGAITPLGPPITWALYAAGLYQLGITWQRHQAVVIRYSPDDVQLDANRGLSVIGRSFPRQRRDQRRTEQDNHYKCPCSWLAEAGDRRLILRPTIQYVFAASHGQDKWL